MTEYDVQFHGKSSIEVMGMASTEGKNNVNLHIPRMLEATKEYGISFEKLFTECVSHEIIHNILSVNEGYRAYNDFDYICSVKQYRKLGKLDFKLWWGGMPW